MNLSTRLFLLAFAFHRSCTHAFQSNVHSSVAQSKSSFCSRKFSSPLPAINGEKAASDESTNFNFIGLNTNNQAPYVPSGMSPEEYQKIKRNEALKQQKMDYGAWGPRFKRSDAPEGDWMVNTNLWIRGFQQQPGVGAVPLSPEETQQQETRRKQLGRARGAVVSFLLAYAVMDIGLLFVSSIRSASTTRKLLSALVLRQGILSALRQHLFAIAFVSKLQLLKLGLASSLVPLVTKYRENAYRKLWSKRRIFATPILASLLVVSAKVGLEMGLSVLR